VVATPPQKNIIDIRGGKKNAGVFSSPVLPLILTFSLAAKKAAKAKGKETVRSKERPHSANASP
jgi:hypothetical protein